MNRVMTAAVLACVGSVSLAGTAAANTSPPRSPVTKQLPGVPCSVTANFSVNSTSATMTNGGGVELRRRHRTEEPSMSFPRSSTS